MTYVGQAASERRHVSHGIVRNGVGSLRVATLTTIPAMAPDVGKQPRQLQRLVRRLKLSSAVL